MCPLPANEPWGLGKKWFEKINPLICRCYGKSNAKVSIALWGWMNNLTLQFGMLVVESCNQFEKPVNFSRNYIRYFVFKLFVSDNLAQRLRNRDVFWMKIKWSKNIQQNALMLTCSIFSSCLPFRLALLNDFGHSSQKLVDKAVWMWNLEFWNRIHKFFLFFK